MTLIFINCVPLPLCHFVPLSGSHYNLLDELLQLAYNTICQYGFNELNGGYNGF